MLPLKAAQSFSPVERLVANTARPPSRDPHHFELRVRLCPRGWCRSGVVFALSGGFSTEAVAFGGTGSAVKELLISDQAASCGVNG